MNRLDSLHLGHSARELVLHGLRTTGNSLARSQLSICEMYCIRTRSLFFCQVATFMQKKRRVAAYLVDTTHIGACGVPTFMTNLPIVAFVGSLEETG